jgi:hypothetical protein
MPQDSFFFVRAVTKPPFSERLAQVQVGDRARFVPEPTNRFDPQAIKIETLQKNGGWLHVGYYPRELCEYIYPAAPQLVGEVTEVGPNRVRVDFENLGKEIPRQSSKTPPEILDARRAARVVKVEAFLELRDEDVADMQGPAD